MTELEDRLPPVHPGEMLRDESLVPRGRSQKRLALYISVPARRVNEILLGRRGISADTALRLARFWMALQMRYDLDRAKDALGSRLDHEVRPCDLPLPSLAER